MTIDQAMQTAIEHQRAGRLREAEALYRQVLAVQPNQPDAIHLLGFLAHQTNHRDEALALIRRAIAIAPDAPDYRHNLGVVLAKAGRYEEALESWREALALRPMDALTQTAIGRALEALGRFPESVTAFREAADLTPNSAEALANVGNALELAGDVDQAAEACQRALAIDPKNATAHHTLANALKDQGRIREAIAAIRRALCSRPDNVRTYSNLLYTLHFDPDADPRAMYHEHCLFNAVYARPLEKQVKPHDNDRSPDRRLRIGYVSPDFRAHSTTFFTGPLLEKHDRLKFEIFCYADVASGDIITDRIRARSDVWRNISTLSDEQAARAIAADKIDILVDLALHTSNGRPLLFARKPAPVQVTWLGYPGTTGLTTMDYRITDVHLDPPGVNDAYYFEESIRLPETMWCYAPLPDSPPVNPLPAISTGRITFGCLNNFSKVNQKVIDLWAEVLAAVPQSRMLLLAPTGASRRRFVETFERSGVGADRVEFVGRRTWEQYMVLYHRIDIVLDTYPWNGHTMSLDGLWMGVPMVSLFGPTAVSRAGLCFLANLGLTDLAASTPAKYIETAARLAGDLPRLVQLRGELRARMQKSALLDSSRFAKNIETAYGTIWERWRSKIPDMS
jgi:protein O-GlcNAc transferase